MKRKIHRKRQKPIEMKIGASADKEEMQKLMDDLIIQTFIESRDVPLWFRGLSQVQLDATDRLHDALEDDMEQETSHRVYRCLQDIGLVPMVKHKRLKLLMRLSRGNDLALLWFLLEAVYKEDRKKDKTFNINEQLIMSSISHLDTITTLRALDRILPAPQLPNAMTETHKDIPVQPQDTEETPQYHIRLPACVSHPDKLVKFWPYFKPQIQPNKRPAQTLAKRPDMEVNFGFYEKYKDPHYKIPNEKTRWFAGHIISQGNRVAQKILKEEITKLLLKYENKKLKETEHIVQDLRHADYDPERNVGTLILEDMLEDMSKGVANDVMCTWHREQAKELEDKRCEKLVEQRELCLAYINDYEIKKEKRREAVRGELAKNVEKYLERYRVMRRDPNNKCACKLLERNSDCVCCIMDDFIDIENACQDNEKETKYGSIQIGEGGKLTPKDNCRISGGMACAASNKCPVGNRLGNGRLSGGMECASSNKCAMDTRFSIKDSFELNSAHSLRYASRNKTDIFFRANTEHLPYMFHYGKIFQYNDKNGNLVIKKQILKELNNNVDEPDQQYYDNIDEELAGAAIKNAAQMWADSNAFKNTPKRISEEREIPKEDAQRLSNKSDGPRKISITDSIGVDDFDLPTKSTTPTWREHVSNRYANMRLAEEKALQRDDEERLSMQGEKLHLGFEEKYYDPEDNELMGDMLKRALAYLARYPKYVLAGMQDAEKLPVLRYWIEHRYGKRYPYEERRELYFKVSKKIFRAMDRTLFAKFPLPTPDVLHYRPPKGFTDYGLQKQLRAEANQVRTEYHQKVDDFVLEYSRLFWLAMRSYLCPRGPPRETYFAYLPARHVDIFHHHLYNRNQVRDIKEIWANRNLQQAKINRQSGKY